MWQYKIVTETRDAQAALDQYGREGWELVHYRPVGPGAEMVLKRPLVEAAAVAESPAESAGVTN